MTEPFWAAILMMFIWVLYWLLTGSIFWTQKSIMKLSISKYRRKDLCSIPIFFTSGLQQNTPKLTNRYPFWKASLRPVAWASTYMPQQERETLVFVETGRSKYPLNNLYVFTKACRSAS